MLKDVIKNLILLKQNEIPFDIIRRDVELPLNRQKIITIPGVRRCGKSSMMSLVINSLVTSGVPVQNILWIGFDDERLRSMSSEDLDIIIQAYMELFPAVPIKDVYFFFDELPLIEGWEYFVLRLYKSYSKNIYICGSNATTLSGEMKSALRGHPLEYEIWPLSFNEFCRFRNITATPVLESDYAKVKTGFSEYINGGAFPEVVLTRLESEKTKILQSYFDAMLLQDLVEHYKIANTGLLRYFIKRLMATLGTPASINAIYNDIRSQGYKVNKDDLYLWGEYACGIYLFVKIPKYNRSLIKEQKSLSKYYPIDTGLWRSVLLPLSQESGKSLENIVLIELMRRKKPNGKISYYGGKEECDFVLQEGDNVVELIQVSWSLSDPQTEKREIRGLLAAAEETGCDSLTIITNDEERVITGHGQGIIRVVPAWKWCLEGAMA